MEWMAYYQLEPWGEEIKNLRAAMNTAATVQSLEVLRVVITKLMGGKRAARAAKIKKFKPEDFMLKFEEGPKKQKKKQGKSWQQMLAIVKEITTALDGKDQRPGAMLVDPYGREIVRE